MLRACGKVRSGGSSLLAMGWGTVGVAGCGSQVLPTASIGGSREILLGK